MQSPTVRASDSGSRAERTYQTVGRRNKPTETSFKKRIADPKTDTTSNERKLETLATYNDRVLLSSEIRHPRLKLQTPAKSNLLYVTDTANNRKFFVDICSSVSLLPATEHKKRSKQPSYDLLATYGSKVATYGSAFINLVLSATLTLGWTFIIAEVDQAILGIDFLQSHNFSFDIRNLILLHQPSQQPLLGKRASALLPVISHINQRNEYNAL